LSIGSKQNLEIRINNDNHYDWATSRFKNNQILKAGKFTRLAFAVMLRGALRRDVVAMQDLVIAPALVSLPARV